MKIIKPHDQTSLKDVVSEIFDYKDLILILSKKDISIKYKQAVLGIAWAVIQPLLTSGIFTFIFKGVSGSAGSKFFDPQIYVAILLWQFFSRSVVEGSNSLVASIGIVSKVYFARAILPITPVMIALVDFTIGFVFYIVLLAITQSEVSFIGVALIPLCLIPIALLALTLSYFLSPINALYRDVGIIVPFFLQLLMYVSPVIYPAELMNNQLVLLSKYVPISNIILNARQWVAMGPSFDLTFGLICIGSLLSMVIALKFFKSREQTIVDVI